MSPGAVAAAQQLSAPAPSPHSPAAGGSIGASRGHGYEPVDGAMVDEANRLLSSGIPISAMANAAGRTPLHAACARAHLPLMRILVAAGIGVADLGAPDARGVTPLMLAARSGDEDAAPRLIELLLRAGVSVSAADATGATACHHGAGRAASLAALIRRGANVNARDKTGISPLMRAAGKGATAAVRILLAAGADATAVDAAGNTAQAYAAAAAGVGNSALLDRLQPPLGLFVSAEPNAAAIVLQLLHRAVTAATAASMPMTPSGRSAAVGGADTLTALTDEGTAPAGASVILPLLSPAAGSSLMLASGEAGATPRLGTTGRQHAAPPAQAPELRHWWEWVWPFGQRSAPHASPSPAEGSPAATGGGSQAATGGTTTGSSRARHRHHGGGAPIAAPLGSGPGAAVSDDPVQRAFVAAAPAFGAGASFVMA